MENDFETSIKSALAEIKGEIEETPAAERVPLLYILQQYETGIVGFAEYCIQPHTSPITVSEVRNEIEDRMHALNIIGSDVGYWIGKIREEAGKKGVMILTKLLTLISSLVRDCIDKLMAVIRAAGKDVAITGYSLGVGVGGYLTFAINFAPLVEE